MTHDDIPEEFRLRHTVHMKLMIATIKVGDRHRKDLGDLEPLARSIEENGLLHPVVVTSDYTLVAGYRRLEACRDVLKWTEIDATVIDPANPVRAEHDENVQRKSLLPSERVAIARILWPQEIKDARARKISRLRKGRISPVRRTFPDGGGRTWDRLGRYVGTSGATLHKEFYIVEAAEHDAGLRYLVEMMDRTRKADRAYRLLQKIERGAPTGMNDFGEKVLLMLETTKREVRWNRGYEIEKLCRSISASLPRLSRDDRGKLLGTLLGNVFAVLWEYRKTEGITVQELKDRFDAFIDRRVKEKRRVPLRRSHTKPTARGKTYRTR